MSKITPSHLFLAFCFCNIDYLSHSQAWLKFVLMAKRASSEVILATLEPVLSIDMLYDSDKSFKLWTSFFMRITVNIK